MTRRVLFCLAAAALVLPACAPLSKSIPVSPQGKAVPKVETPLSGPTRIASPRAYAHYLRANAYRFQGQLDLAMAEMEKAVAADPGSALLLSHAASLYLQNGRLAEAAQASELALATKPEDTALLMQTAGIYSSVNRQDDAIRLYERVLSLDPAQREAHIFLGTLYLQQANTEQAVEIFNRLAEKDTAEAERGGL